MSSSHEKNDVAAMSLMEYDEFLEIPFDEIVSATDNFSYENLLTQGTSFTVYKGQLLEQSGDLINIVVRRCPQKIVAANELIMIKNLKHKNIVSPFKAGQDENGQGFIIINKHEANGSLDKHLSDPTLTWMQRLHICVGVARALSYLHNDVEDNRYVLHGNIKSSKILLDHNWEPKLHGFGFAIRAKKHHLHVTGIYKGSLQYMDPTYENTKGLTHKSDVFSFGVLLFEILFGRAATSFPDNDNWYFARSARSHYEDKKLDDLIDPSLKKQMNLESLNIFAETSYWCLKEKRSQRPNMNQILLRLERALELQRTHEHLAVAVVEDTSSNNLKGKNLDRLKLRLSDLELATNKFSNIYCIGSGGYGMVYKAELDHFNDISSSTIEGKVASELSKKRSTVAIKRIFSRVDGQGEQGFFAEIEMLSKCKHPNIVSLLGFCVEGPEMLLVYEYASNGSLDDYLGNINNMTNLTWAQRIQICIDIAHGLKYLHKNMKGKQSIIHRDIKSANILLDGNWVAKIADFGLSKLHRTYQQGSTLFTNNIAGTKVYLDPEYLSTGKLKTKSDIYSFGVVMFEIMCGKLAYDKTYNEGGLPSVARHCFNEGTLEKLVDPRITEDDENIYLMNGGINQDSLDTFSKTAYQCLAKTQSERPTIEVIIKELEKALNFQVRISFQDKNWKDNLHISLQAIKLGTQNFSDCNCIGEGRFWKLYEGELTHANRCSDVFVKRWDATSRQGHIQFVREYEALLKYKHKNIIGLVGYCNEMNEKIIVYDHASKGRLNKHLANPSLTWIKRLKICIDVANGLEFLHTSDVKEEDSMVHRDIKSSSILLDDDWSAKISNLELSAVEVAFENFEHVDDEISYSLGYVDPYAYEGFLTQYSDIYSLGVILLEILCGRLAWTEGCVDNSQSLGPLALRRRDKNGKLDDQMIFDGIKEQMVPESLYIFQTIAFDCLKDDPEDRPSISEVVKQLNKALKFQEDHEIWEPKLPIDYKQIIQWSKAPNILDTEMKKNIYDMFCKGILLRGKVCFSLGANGERNEMISARKFSYKNRWSLKWQRIQISRFQKAAKMLDITKLKIRIRITTQLLSPGVNYGAYIIFKFPDTRKFSSKPIYVGLKYRMGGENLHAYFATWRDDEWMMIELCRFLCDKKNNDFEVELESFSRYYCRSDAIYIEGIEFRVIESVKNEKFKEAQEILNSDSSKDRLLYLRSVVNWTKYNQLSFLDYELPGGKNCYGLFYDFEKLPDVRYEEPLELWPQQVYHITCRILRGTFLADIEYSCYLVFKISEKCHGLHCPVKVRDLLHRNNKEAGIIYFRAPGPCNLHCSNNIPQLREDGWMEVKVWKFNSSHIFNTIYDDIPVIRVKLKLITYEGTMSGLVVRGLEIRSM
ncbi:hypothetical protein SSX86_030187 [Deinandra increscens subsp. villosa]|uniref:non-specific serine/threonine protein kinase n=1 Tax=Deinandra increscens subsp. villosa TaxID=3103831 RepID=A0AAP0CC16_9ASTR